MGLPVGAARLSLGGRRFSAMALTRRRRIGIAVFLQKLRRRRIVPPGFAQLRDQFGNLMFDSDGNMVLVRIR